MPLLSPEFEIVRLAARAELDDAHAAALVEAAAAVDWKQVLELGSFHRVLPHLHRHLLDHARAVIPDEVASSLRDHARRTAVRVLFLTTEMAKISDGLDRAQIPFLILKGPSLSSAYGGAVRRPFSDNDLLISSSDFERVETALLELGFNQRKRSDRQRDGYLFVHHEYTFGRAVGPHVSTVDVHTEVAPMGYAYHGTYEHLAGRARTIEVGGRSVQALDWPDLFLALCVNAFKDLWSRLRLASDLVALAPLIDDWEQLEDRARQDRCLRAFRTGVLVANDLLGHPFPAHVTRRARADWRASRIARNVCARMPETHHEGLIDGLERAAFMLGAQDGPAGVTRYLSYVAIRRLTERWVSPFDA